MSVSLEHDVAERHETYWRLFLRFLRFGFLAWGGPVAQIAMLRQELVEEERWISRERFNRVLGIYQVLPGPEAHELCVYFGMLARGRVGGLLAGLGFMLPGFVLMFALSWFYVRFGLSSPLFQAVFLGVKPAVAALIVRAVHRIGQHALTDRWLGGIAVAAAIATLLDVHFLPTLAFAGVIYALVRRAGAGTHEAPLLSMMPFLLLISPAMVQVSLLAPSLVDLLGSGLRAGLLTFGGAYTVIPFLQEDAVIRGGWMTNSQFLDGLALSGILPAPLIIFATFVGYLGGGPGGALALTIGIFFPAFAFTLLGHNILENAIENPALHTFLDGVTAGVVGLIAATTLTLFPEAVTSLPALFIFGVALLLLYRWHAKVAAAGVILGSGVLGWLFSMAF